MKFDIMKAKTIYKTGVVRKCVQESTDFSEPNDEYAPISDNIFKYMKESAANPRYVKVIGISPTDENSIPKMYVEAFEFFTYCEAANKSFDEAAQDIIIANTNDNPELENAEFHVVFPSDCMNKNILGGENLGKAIKDDWAMQLIRGCRRYGLKVNIGKESDYPTVGENNNKDIENDDKKEAINNESFIDQIDNMVDKAASKVDKEASERKEAMEKISNIKKKAKEDAQKIIDEFNAKNKKKKEQKYSEIKDKKED